MNPQCFYISRVGKDGNDVAAGRQAGRKQTLPQAQGQLLLSHLFEEQAIWDSQILTHIKDLTN